MTALDASSIGIVFGLTLVAAGELVGYLGLSLLGAGVLALSIAALFALTGAKLLSATRRTARNPGGMIDETVRPRR